LLAGHRAREGADCDLGEHKKKGVNIAKGALQGKEEKVFDGNSRKVVFHFPSDNNWDWRLGPRMHLSGAHELYSTICSGGYLFGSSETRIWHTTLGILSALSLI
jgi:hypothetical protein